MARRARGASAIEFALALPILVVLIAAVLDYGWYFFVETMAIHAVREAAREGAMVPESADPNGADLAAASIANSLAQAGIDCSDGSATCTVQTGYSGPSGGRLLQLDVRLAYSGLTGIVPVPEAISARASAFLEGQSDAGDRTDCASGQSGCSGARVPTSTAPTIRGVGRQVADTGR